MPETTEQNPATAPLIIAIDGPSGAGKSTVARRLADRLGIPYLDTGAMYRAAGLLALRAGLRPPLDEDAGPVVAGLLDRHRLEVATAEDGVRVRLDGEDVSAAIRTPEASLMASAVSALPSVRRALVPLQRALGARGGVMEGRDIGTVVFPDATLKVYLTAAPRERAQRRVTELRERGHGVSFDEVLAQQEERDARDSTRADSPLRRAPDAVRVDSSGCSVDAVVDEILGALARRRGKPLDTLENSTIKSRNRGRFERT